MGDIRIGDAMPTDYDVVIVGGGLAGSGLGAALAKTGARVLITEREAQFRDRVQGEGVRLKRESLGFTGR
jgi:flavin-dependent dehydrogenase